jgi:hypothetical protein
MPSISTKRAIISHIKPLNIKKTMTSWRNPGHDLGRAQKCDGVKPVNENPIQPHPLIIGTPTTTQIYTWHLY